MKRRANIEGRRWRCLLLVVLLIACAIPETMNAWGNQPTLTVQLMTVADVPVVNVAIEVVDATNNRRLATGVTDSKGQVRLAAMPAVDVRVRCTGMLPDGISLRHTRQDQYGIWVNLPAQDWTMELRADTDGLIFPDLGLGNAGAVDAGAATAIAMGTLPTISMHTPLARAPTRTTVPQPRSLATAETRGTAMSHMPASDTPAVTLLVVLISMVGGVLWLKRRGAFLDQ